MIRCAMIGAYVLLVWAQTAYGGGPAAVGTYDTHATCANVGEQIKAAWHGLYVNYLCVWTDR